ncbi:LEAF RUST 10 DISEASE-RESISTANCE LOCUS RECEPTOR-LIKE PROTEIN KINASE-like 2.4 [Ipomoea triloba]|uniref:LEAF RUST 10 DISEASE-RESISTANCE LOCUS RECEPTOR-LIKE PROTEIN KINASE-like 2.4 n=1 Tax=Ipomoea triloba TaxID=35885 RepID=UPI00125E21E6|nr:LEAF RUST 10 DISEASE-RESISTANCE LOCUS RECEPTOR-LIKE PROTEIN KINASE-like 2.4 [Ipomoea triloba]
MDDFNDILHQDEKRGGNPQPMRLIKGFRDAVEPSELRDYSFDGYQFTWERSKGTPHWIEAKLDRGYGFVYKGKLANGTFVAVKLLKELNGSGEEFINEVASISRTSHVNIVTLLGFCVEGDKRALLYEFMPNGSLESFIYDGKLRSDRQLEWLTLYKITIGIARGLEYLHRGCRTKILHFDIKPHNILLDEDFCPKISDFGLAKLHTTKESFVSITGARGTIGYVAPEVACRNFGAVSHKADVYSYGMMVLEIVSGRKNVEHDVDRNSEIYFPHWIYRQIELDKELFVVCLS